MGKVQEPCCETKEKNAARKMNKYMGIRTRCQTIRIFRVVVSSFGMIETSVFLTKPDHMHGGCSTLLASVMFDMFVSATE
jgi:hypothetical protein